MPKNVDIDVILKLINDVQEYINSASNARNTLLNTIDMCEAVMGNDEIFKSQKPKLEASVESLKKVIGVSANLKSQLQIKYEDLKDFKENLKR